MTILDKGGTIMELLFLGILGLLIGRKPTARQEKDPPLKLLYYNTFTKANGEIQYHPVYGR
jgi:hypothetical protein